jgi:hypothetical protein
MRNIKHFILHETSLLQSTYITSLFTALKFGPGINAQLVTILEFKAETGKRKKIS